MTKIFENLCLFLLKLRCATRNSKYGRRLYQEKDLTLLKLICFLSSIGLSLKEEEHDEVSMMLLDQQDTHCPYQNSCSEVITNDENSE